MSGPISRMLRKALESAYLMIPLSVVTAVAAVADQWGHWLNVARMLSVLHSAKGPAGSAGRRFTVLAS